MKLSTKGRYGLRAVVDLAILSGAENAAVSLNTVANRQQISVGYLEQLIARLKKAGIVESTRGAQGGYTLARPAAEISVGEVLRALEGDLKLVECVDMKEEELPCGPASKQCVTRVVWQKINDSINAAIDHLMLSDLVEEGVRMQENEA
ncbi:MAG: Rrf2 family transcriptional regulator [Lachnospiraceae bacterium]|nr:Rrf2 family transcriptional regulator [Lachnospiraceae bacterium]